MYGTYFHNWSCSQDTSYRKFRRILGILHLQGLQRSSGRIFPIFASQIKAVRHEVQMHFLSYPPPKFTKLFWAHFWDFHFASKRKKFCAHFLYFCVQKWRYFQWSSDAFWKFSACTFYRKTSWRNFTSYASKTEAVCCDVQTHLGSPLPCKVCKKSSGRIITIYVSINEGISREVQMHLGSFRLARFTQKVLGAFPWFVSKSEAVCCEVQTQFWRFHLACFI